MNRYEIDEVFALVAADAEHAYAKGRIAELHDLLLDCTVSYTHLTLPTTPYV